MAGRDAVKYSNKLVITHNSEGGMTTQTTKPKNTTKFGPGNPGKPKGAINKSTMLAREAIANLVDQSTPQMQKWLDEIAETEGPLRAWQCLTDVLEYHIPKLARTEMVGEGGGPLTIEIVRFGDHKAS